MIFFMFTGCVSLTGPSFDLGDGPVKYDVDGVWKVRVFCDAYSEGFITIYVDIEQDEKDLVISFTFDGKDIVGTGNINDKEDIWMGGVYKEVAKAELEGKIIPGNPLKAEGSCIIQEFGKPEEKGTFTATKQ